MAAVKNLEGCISSKSGTETFDELRYKLYHSNSVKFDLEKLPPTSTTFSPNIDIDPLEYGYLLKDGKFLPDMEWQELPDDFSISCSCLKYIGTNTCPCQRKLIPCCTF